YRGGNPLLLGGSLIYRRSAWERAPFADLQVGEDHAFVCAAAGVRHDLADPALCVGLIHIDNASDKRTDSPYFERIASPEVRRVLGDDAAAYDGALTDPLISCIMPTRDRRRFVPLTLGCFQSQDWPHRELVVVDDGSDPVGDLCEGVPGVRYIRVPW